MVQILLGKLLSPKFGGSISGFRVWLKANKLIFALSLDSEICLPSPKVCPELEPN